MKVDILFSQNRISSAIAGFMLFVLATSSLHAADNSATAELLKPVFQLSSDNSADQDDYAVWINRSDSDWNHTECEADHHIRSLAELPEILRKMQYNDSSE